MAAPALALLAWWAIAAPAAARKFYDDDPLEREPKPIPVKNVKARKLSDYYDFFLNTFASPGDRHTKKRTIPAQAVNTLGEVPDSSWYTNRHGSRRMSIEELLLGPDRSGPPSPEGPWTVLRAKTEGITPGFQIEDSAGARYFIKFDPVEHPEMATAADVIGSDIFHALGYNVPENYLVFFDREQLRVTERSEITDSLGKHRAMTERDLFEILPRQESGRYRAVASRLIPGKGVGPFRYHGTRKDDPNDVVPHEHRRDLRGLFVFCAWVGHDDSRSINTYDSVVEEGGTPHIKHYLIDFGSILGSASTKANSARSGNEHLFAWTPAIVEFTTLGLYVPRWARARYPDLPAVGRFEYEVFEPERYKTEYPNPAFMNRLPDDTFWAAQKVMAFTDEEIRAIVAKGRYSDPEAERWIAKCLIERRNKIGRTYLTRVLPLDRFRVEDGRLRFEDAAVRHGFAEPAEYLVAWSRFDNEKETTTAVDGRSFALPGEALKAADGEYFAAEILGKDRRRSVTVYVRKRAGAWQVVGIDRRW